MTKQQENKAFVKMLKEFPKAFGRVSFRERLMLRTAFTYVVEEVTDDLKANADLTIEGRDIKIKELELELTVEKDLLQEETKLHLHAEEYNKSLEEENNKLLDVINNQDVKIADLEKENAYLKDRYNKVDIIGYDALKNLTKAKERIRALLFHLTNDTFYVTFETQKQSVERARQFLRGIGK